MLLDDFLEFLNFLISVGLLQYVLLKLLRPAILQKIAFVQHNGEANCNVKSFQLFAGLSEDGCEMLLEGLFFFF